jgi:hypothetical protein
MNSVTFEHVAYALALTVGAVSMLGIGAVLVLCLVKKFGENDDESS